MKERQVKGGLESVRRAGVDGQPTMAERGKGTTFSKLQGRVTQMKKKGDFEGNLQGLKDWKGKGTPRQTSTDKIERGVRKFRDNHTKQLANSLVTLKSMHQMQQRRSLMIFQSGLLSSETERIVWMMHGKLGLIRKQRRIRNRINSKSLSN